jgi:hypothetical protein
MRDARCAVRCQAKNKPHATGTRVGVLFAGWPAPLEALLFGAIVASPKRRRFARVGSFRSVGSNSSNPSLCWLPLDIVEPRPRIRSCHRRSGKIGQLRTPWPSWCSTFGSGMLIRLISQSMSSQISIVNLDIANSTCRGTKTAS